MIRKAFLALTVIGALAFSVATPNVASAERGHSHHQRHGPWRGHHSHGHWRRPVVYPPVYVGGYYPVRTYYAVPYYGYPRYYSYGSGVSISFGW